MIFPSQEMVLTLKLKAAELEDRVALLASQLSESEAERAAAEAREAAVREGAAGHRRETREAALAAESEHRWVGGKGTDTVVIELCDYRPHRMSQ